MVALVVLMEEESSGSGSMFDKRGGSSLKRNYEEPSRSSVGDLGVSGGKRFRRSVERDEAPRYGSGPSGDRRSGGGNGSNFRGGGGGYSASSQDMHRGGDNSMAAPRWTGSGGGANVSGSNLSPWGLANKVLSHGGSGSGGGGGMSATAMFLGGGSSGAASLSSTQSNSQPRFDAYKSLHSTNPVARRF